MESSVPFTFRVASGERSAVTVYNLWSIDSANQITATDDPAEMREIIRALLVAGWSLDNLYLGIDNTGPALSGAELGAWLEERT
jgi:hypothetical protein